MTNAAAAREQYRQQRNEIWGATGRIDRPATLRAVRRLHAAAGLPRPAIGFVSSPLAMYVAGGFASGVRRLHATDSVHYEIGNGIPTIVRAYSLATEIAVDALATLCLPQVDTGTLKREILAATAAVTSGLQWPAASEARQITNLLGPESLSMVDGIIASGDDSEPVHGFANLPAGEHEIVPACPAQRYCCLGFFPHHPVQHAIGWVSGLASEALESAKTALATKCSSPVMEHVACLLACAARSLVVLHEDYQLQPSPFSTDSCIWRGHGQCSHSVCQRHHEVAVMAGPQAYHPGFCLVSERPAEVHLDGERLHCETGPAIRWLDGVRLWSIGGVSLPLNDGEQIVMRPSTQTLEQIDSEENVEVKRIRIERFGWTRYLTATDATVVDRRRNEIEGTREMLCRRGEMNVLVCHCPSTGRVYALDVPSEIHTCQQAQTWLWASDLSPYGPARIIGRS